MFNSMVCKKHIALVCFLAIGIASAGCSSSVPSQPPQNVTNTVWRWKCEYDDTKIAFFPDKGYREYDFNTGEVKTQGTWEIEGQDIFAYYDSGRVIVNKQTKRVLRPAPYIKVNYRFRGDVLEIPKTSWFQGILAKPCIVTKLEMTAEQLVSAQPSPSP